MITKPKSEEYRRFESLLGRVLTVSKSELNSRLDAEKREKRSPKTPASRAADVSSKAR